MPRRSYRSYSTEFKLSAVHAYMPPMELRFRMAANVLHVLGIATLAACATPPLTGNGDHADSAPLGSMTLSGPTFGHQTLLPTVCVSGERQFFLGFDLHDEKVGVVTRLVVEPATGPVVRVFAASAPFDKTVLFHRPECRVFHFSLDSTGWLVNRIQQLNVSLDLDCQLPSGDSIVGNASDPGCL
jgi:hypothetical protein